MIWTSIYISFAVPISDITTNIWKRRKYTTCANCKNMPAQKIGNFFFFLQYIVLPALKPSKAAKQACRSLGCLKFQKYWYFDKFWWLIGFNIIICHAFESAKAMPLVPWWRYRSQVLISPFLLSIWFRKRCYSNKELQKLSYLKNNGR